ncbi:hypothetical protein [Gordonia sp. 'Campus']|uniref:hypothetical protein n=1 Tax=Gordonia sp. 'Campus' TaxID=2915824 RepID=UPI001EE439FD|nr:hypothetical protein [Gordonia sp. 'Campus']
MTIELDAQKLSVQPTAGPRSTVSIGRPAFRVAVAGDAVAQGFPIVVRRETLRDAQRARSLVRAGSHDQANFVVALEVEVAVASDAASARASAARAQVAAGGGSSNPAGGGSVTSVVGGSTPAPGTIRYVGTTHGLLTLLRDIYAAEVADAVILVPIDGDATERRIREQVLPVLEDQRYRVA